MTTRTKLFFYMLIGTGILLLAGSPVRAQGNMPGALAKTTQLVTYGKALPNAGRIISSAEVGKSAAALLNAKRLPDQALAARVQRQVLRQTMEKGYFPGLYRPDYTQTQTVAYLRSVTKALSDLYPNTKRRFAPVTVSSFQELMDIWANGPKEEFMEARNAVSLIVERTASRRVGFYAVAVESTPKSGRALHDILLLDVNRASWVSLRKSMAKARQERTAQLPGSGN